MSLGKPAGRGARGPGKKGGGPKKPPIKLDKTLWSDSSVIVRVQIAGDLVRLEPTRAGGTVCFRFFRSVKGLPPFPVNVNVDPKYAQYLTEGMRVAGDLRIREKRDGNKVSYYCTLVYNPSATPTHKLKIHSLKSELKASAKVLYKLELGEGVIAVVQMEKPPLK